MPEHLQEFVDSQGLELRVDAERGVLRGVKLLGLTSRNGRTYQEAALADAATLYEGVKVNVNHAKAGPLAPRDYQDRLGAIRGVAFRPGEGLFGDLHFNPKHALAEQLAWDAVHAPEQVGLSHNVLAETRRDGQATVVEAITKVESVDLVADPATTRGLFEHAGDGSQISEQLDAARGEIERLERRLRIVELLAEHGLPLPGSRDSQRVVSEAFVQMLSEAKTDEALAALVADRAALVCETRSRTQPIESREQRWFDESRGDSVRSAEEFAASLRR
jgi:hypothetical protein